MPILAAKRQLKSHSLKIRLLKNVKVNEIRRIGFSRLLFQINEGKLIKMKVVLKIGDVTITYLLDELIFDEPIGICPKVFLFCVNG